MGIFRRRKNRTAPPAQEPADQTPEPGEGTSGVTLADIMARVDVLAAKLDSGDDKLVAPADRLMEAGDRLAKLLDIARARHPELGLESVLELSGLSRGTHYTEADGGYVLKMPGELEYRIAVVPLDLLVDGNDPEGFAGVVREMFDAAEILLFPEYALAELLSKHPEMVSEAAKSSTVLGTPSTILAMLGWVKKEWRYADRVGELGKVAGDLSAALREFAAKYVEVGKRLNGARQMYNGSIMSWSGVERTAGLAAEAVGIELAKPEKVTE